MILGLCEIVKSKLNFESFLFSIYSGDSDLIGVEDNPEFDMGMRQYDVSCHMSFAFATYYLYFVSEPNKGTLLRQKEIIW